MINKKVFAFLLPTIKGAQIREVTNIDADGISERLDFDTKILYQNF